MPKICDIQSVYIFDGVRTVFGRRFGSLKRQSAAELAATAVEGLLKRTKISKNIINEVILGNAVSAGAGQNLARQVISRAGLSLKTTGYTVNTVCGAGLHAVALGAQSIMLGESQVVLAGGTESASNNPSITFKTSEQVLPDDFKDSLMTDGLTCAISGQKMGEIMEALVKKHGISRDRQDAFAIESHRKAYQAYQKRLETGEVIAVAAARSRILDIDECIRKITSLPSLTSLPSAFLEKGTLTAGNSSVPCDGAAVVCLAGGETIRKYQWKPAARILGFAHIAVEPENTFEASIEAVKACLRRTGVSLSSIDLFEIGEAFAAEALLIRDALKIPDEKLNIWGGDLAVGHPLGAAGARILVTLIKALEDRRLKRGLCAIAYGGGGAVGMIVENCRLDVPLFPKIK